MVDCTGCAHRSKAGAEQYCSEFQDMPQISSGCSSHSKFDAEKAVARSARPTGTFIGIREVKNGNEAVK